ncbi:MAG: hypothetical protein BWY39_00612 [Spirochaetes bacterium ADurb.Bin269]|nr:MAG: hypothetical protein BWY39_00612 [Spirochaetes bacterium ADurb.Bin269]
MTVVALDDWMIAVIPKPVRTAEMRFPVMKFRMRWSPSPALF